MTNQRGLYFFWSKARGPLKSYMAQGPRPWPSSTPSKTATGYTVFEMVAEVLRQKRINSLSTADPHIGLFSSKQPVFS